MRLQKLLLLLAVLCVSAGGISLAQELPAPLLDSIGSHTHAVTTDNEQAQRYFNQGLILHYGFNHAEAVRSFRSAQQLDPDCAMAYWGEALSFGPHINAGMSAAAVEEAWDAIQRAQELASGATAREQAYIDALSARYAAPPANNRGELNAAYVDAMRDLAQRYPDDPDAQALFAEALMITTAWDYWTADGAPNAIGEEIMTTLERSMEQSPDHPGTNHFYIHTVETDHPERGMAAADRLRGMVPDAGHLLHMPSHVYLQMGRYADASDVNDRAVRADARYLEEHGAHGMYRISYIPHNAIYLCFSAVMEGRRDASLEAANTTRDLIIEDWLMRPGYGSLTQGFALRYIVMARFGMWAAMLEEQHPPTELEYPTAIWHFGRGLAFVRTDQHAAARTELENLRNLSSDDAVARMDAWSEATTRRAVLIAVHLLEAEIAAAQGSTEAAIAAAEEAVDIESRIGYYEPPVWYIMPRHVLGALLLADDRAAEAEQVYRDDLEEWPENGWALFGLYQALEAQGRSEDAAGVRERFDAAWSRSDTELSSSRL